MGLLHISPQPASKDIKYTAGKIKRIIKKIIPKFILVWREKLYKYPLQRRKTLHFQLLVAEHCNLNCKYCGVLSPLVKHPKFMDMNILKRDLTRLFELTSGGGAIRQIVLLGGEPLLFPDLLSLLSFIRTYFSGLILIVTNGTLLLKQSDEFWQNCKDNRVVINTSIYPKHPDISAITEKAHTFGFDVSYEDETKTMWKIPFDLQGKQNPFKSFRNCNKANYCITLDEGKLYTCHTIPMIKHFNSYFNQNMLVSEKDYIDIYKAKNIDEILDFMCRPVPFCRYCNQQAIEHDLEWGISQKDIAEWT
jgi:MoaA/NifB/PqqE/SkfB family radical SAM enzyme